MALKTHEQFVEEVRQQRGDEYTVLGQYKGNKTKILMKHNTCGYEWEVRPDNFLNNKTKCFACYGKKKLNTEGFKKELFKLTNGEYELVDGQEYVSDSTKLLIRHNTCGTEYYTTPNNFLQGRRCKKCSALIVKQKLTHTTEHFKQRLYDVTNGEYELVDGQEYQGDKVKLKV